MEAAAPGRYQARYQRLRDSDSDGEQEVELRVPGPGPGRASGSSSLLSAASLKLKCLEIELRLEDGNRRTSIGERVAQRVPGQNCWCSLPVLLPQRQRETCARIASALLLLALTLAWAFYRASCRGSSWLGRSQAPGQDGAEQPGAGDLPSAAHVHAQGTYHQATIITSSETCSHLGKELLVAGGNVVDAGIAAALCLGLVHPHAGGLGGVFWALLRNASSGRTLALHAVPHQSPPGRYGLPAALPGLRLLHHSGGRLAWARLLEGPALLAQRGFRVDRVLAAALRENAPAVRASGLCSLFCNGAGELKDQGALVTHPRLAALLRALASQDDALARALAPDLPPAEQGPFLQALRGLSLELQSPLALQLGNARLYGAPGPAAGSLLASILQEVQAAQPEAAPDPCLRALSAAQQGYARGLGGTVAGDPSPVGSHLAVADSQGNMLLLSASLNSSFGSKFLAPTSGVLLSDFAAPAGPGLHSWACPVVLSLGAEGAVVGLGATGHSTAPLALAQAIINQLYLGQSPQEALESPWLQLRGERAGAPQGCGPGTPSNLSAGGWTGGASPGGPWVLQVASQSKHVRAFAAPAACCHPQGV